MTLGGPDEAQQLEPPELARCRDQPCRRNRGARPLVPRRRFDRAAEGQLTGDRRGQPPPRELLFVGDLLARLAELTGQPYAVWLDGEPYRLGAGAETRIELCCRPLIRSGETDRGDETEKAVFVLSDCHQGRRPRLAQSAPDRYFYWYQWPELVERLLGDAAAGSRLPHTAILLSDTAAMRSAFAAAADARGVGGWASRLGDPLPTGRPMLALIDAWAGTPVLSGADGVLGADGALGAAGVQPRVMAAVRRARSAYPAATIVVLDDFPRWELAERWMQAGANGVCGKPLDLSRLLKLAGRIERLPLFGGTST